MRIGARGSRLVWVLLLAACTDQPPEAEPRPGESGAAQAPGANTVVRAGPAADSVNVQVFFTLGEEPAPFARTVARTDPPVAGALRALLAGPTEEERAAGAASFFGPRTAGMLRRVVVADGTATVDFEDFSGLIPNASSSAGSGQLLSQLNATVFQFREIERVVYRFEGSCERFWSWLQRGCEVVER